MCEDLLDLLWIVPIELRKVLLFGYQLLSICLLIHEYGLLGDIRIACLVLGLVNLWIISRRQQH